MIPIDKANAALAIKKAIASGSYIFGGYVRDYVAGKDFEDMDVYFPSVNEFQTFLRNIGAAGYSTPYVRDGKYVKHAMHQVHDVQDRNGKRLFKLDCIVNDAYRGNNAPVLSKDWDADINAIAMNSDGIISSLLGKSPAELKQLIRKIQRHEFTALPGMSEWRRDKLLKKGFTEMKDTPIKSNPEESYWDMFKDDGADAAYRVAGTQMVQGVKQGMALAIAAKGANSEAVKGVSELLNTEVGDIAVAAVLGAICTFTPQLKDVPKVKRLAKEFRVQGMATGGNMLADVVREYFLPSILEAIKKLPEVPEEGQMRVASPATRIVEKLEEMEAEEEIVPAPLKKAI